MKKFYADIGKQIKEDLRNPKPRPLPVWFHIWLLRKWGWL